MNSITPYSEISGTVPAAMETTWHEAPRERTPAYHPVFYRVARVMQTVVREYADSVWIPADHARNIRLTTGVLAWISSEPARRNTVSEFTYEVLSAPLMASFFWSVGRKLPVRLDRLVADLIQARQFELADPYLPRRIVKIVDGLKQNRKVINRLIGSDETLMRDLLRYAAIVTASPRPRPAAAAKLHQSWTRTLKRMLPGSDLSGCIPALVAAVTREMQDAQADFKAEESLRAADRNRSAVSADTQCCRDATPAPNDAQSEHPRSADGACACTPENC